MAKVKKAAKPAVVKSPAKQVAAKRAVKKVVKATPAKTVAARGLTSENTVSRELRLKVRSRPAHGLRLPIVDVEHARLSSLDLSSSGVSLVREEHIFLFHLGHSIRMSFDLFVPNVSAIDCFNYLEQVGRQTLKRDHCVSRLHSGNSSTSLQSEISA